MKPIQLMFGLCLNSTVAFYLGTEATRGDILLRISKLSNNKIDEESKYIILDSLKNKF